MQRTEVDTGQRRAKLVAEFQRRRRRQLLVSIPLVVVILGVGAVGGEGGVLGVSQVVLAGVLVALIFGMLLFSFRNWRCPACDAYLGRYMNPRHCSACGALLRD